MQHVLVPNGIPTPPASPLSWDQQKYLSPHQQQQQHFFQPPHPHHIQQRYVPVTPEERIGLRLEESLQLTGIIGTGAYGVVYQAVDLKTSTRYAVKALSKLNPDGSPLDARQLEYQDREISLHYAASAHPNVVSMLKIIDVYPDCLYVVLEYCPEGDLFYNITECGHFVGKDELARRVFLQILDAVDHLHQLGIYHRDLKPENILVANGGETLKLADFGLATSAEQSEDYGCGSTFYMSPECLGQSSAVRPYYYCAPNDVWSLGVILVNLTCGRNPWKQASHEDSTYRAYTRNSGFLKTILPLTDELDAILARIFTPNPDQRITLPQLRQLILACPRLTAQPQQQVAAPAVVQSVLTPPASDDHSNAAAAAVEETMVPTVETPADFDNFATLSPASSVLSSASSVRTCTSSISSVMDSLLDDDETGDVFLCQDVPEIMTPPPVSSVHPLPCHPAHNDMLAVYEPEDASMIGGPYLQQQQQQHQQQQQQLHLQPTAYHVHQTMHMPQDYVTFHHPIAVPHPDQPLTLQQPLPMPPVLLHQQHPVLTHPSPSTPLLQQQQQQQQIMQQPITCGSASKFLLWDWVIGRNGQSAQQFRSFHPMSILPIPHSVFLPGCH
ncbi:protein serine threonine kinase [Grosmannia clavigera kw1407]|uniref:Autophagy-related protein 1 n=1 Tax=Grosmannia clavigera (strain kw1407 / UAMH 11150) TaxID=655863 RepID=F0XPE0_GROCL|nr:protein serine threonine kinase [Grosmannia clavigera kw1407]EFX00294.1 protein serine threonine kinase [Grosmannia clavigera kw1407]